MSVSLDKTPKLIKRFVPKYDPAWGTWGTWDTHLHKFSGHTGSEAGAKLQSRKMNQDPTR